MLESTKTNLVNIFKQNNTVNMEIGARIEYNMNSILDNIVVSTVSTDSQYLSQIKDASGNASTLKVNPFKKLFPVESIAMPNRPKIGGIKYYISTSSEYPLETNNYSTLKVFEYPSNKPRVYYAGDTNEYKYFVTPIGANLDVKIKYKQNQIGVTQAYSDGKKIHFTTNGSHGFSSGLIVTVSNMGAFNIGPVAISDVPKANMFSVDSTIAINKVVQNGIATLAMDTKNAFTNKIVVTFEKNHYVPENCTVYLKLKNQAESSIGTFSVPTEDSDPLKGKLILHYVDKATDGWESGPDDIYGIRNNIEFKYAEPLEIEHIRITATNIFGKIIGLIALEPRWVKDISSDLVSFQITKEASANSEDYLPIGKVSSNSLNMQITRYLDNEGKQSSVQILNFSTSDEFIKPSYIYMIKGAEIKPYFKVLHSNGTTMTGQYDVVKQGTYYLDSWVIGPTGSTNMNAYDGAKTLMETIAPERFYEGYTTTGIIIGLLDSVGFTNYKINVTTNDKSIPSVNYWWSDGRKSVWDCIQEICNDIQMNAIFDEDNVLQISSREYIYDKTKTKSFNFTYDLDGTILPNIVKFASVEVPSKNQVKIIYTNPFYSSLIGSSTDLYMSPTTYLAAGSLITNVTEAYPVEGGALEIEVTQPTEFSNIGSPFSFQGYVLINSEIIEYDAIQYKLIRKDTGLTEYVWIESESDIAKYINLAERPKQLQPNAPSTFGPSNKLRIKQRGALGTKIGAHTPTSKTFEGGKWKAYKATWQ